MGLYKVKDTDPCYARRKRNSRQITLHLSSGLCPLPQSIRYRGRGSLDPPFLNWLRTCLIHINHFSTLHLLTWRPGRKPTDLPFFIPVPSGPEADTVCLLTAGKRTSLFHLKWFPASLATNHFFPA